MTGGAWRDKGDFALCAHSRLYRKIIHFDLDAFFCAVEELRDPALRGKPFAVGGRPEERGVVASCSYPARQRGVHSAMPMSQAVRLCPQLLIVPARHSAYRATSEKVMACLRALTPLVEQLSIDEAFLDVTALAATGETLAHTLQARINGELHLSCSLGVASNKLVAKIANTAGKAAAADGRPPNRVTVVPDGDEASFLAPLPADALWGVGPKTAAKLADLGIHTIGELARWPEGDLSRRFGKNGADLAQHARGLDHRPVVTDRESKSISAEITFVRDVDDGAELRRTIQSQAEEVSRSLRAKELFGATVKLKLRWSDFTTLTRQTTLTQATDDAAEIYRAAERLFTASWAGQPVRLIGVGVSGLVTAARQLGLWEQPNEKEERLQQTLRGLQARFGATIIKRGARGGTQPSPPRRPARPAPKGESPQK
ncbi:MAG TPA: DNA polymerase IV [Caldilineaceae bacterium]|nr:DNA polymerase IV [Caldilineaceae bacterium]